MKKSLSSNYFKKNRTRHRGRCENQRFPPGAARLKRGDEPAGLDPNLGRVSLLRATASHLSEKSPSFLTYDGKAC